MESFYLLKLFIIHAHKLHVLKQYYEKQQVVYPKKTSLKIPKQT